MYNIVVVVVVVVAAAAAAAAAAATATAPLCCCCGSYSIYSTITCDAKYKLVLFTNFPTKYTVGDSVEKMAQ